jgi:adenylate cyclase
MGQTSSLELTVRRALEDERLRTSRRLATLRAATLLVVLGLSAVLALHQEDWRVYLPLLAPYTLVALGVAAGAYAWPRFARWSAAMVPLVDVPIVYVLQARSLPLSPSPGGVAGFTVGVFIFCLVLATLSLDRWMTAATAAVAIVLETRLQAQAGISSGSQAAAALILLLSAAATDYLTLRLRGLIGQVADQELRRARLGRYFSPSVAARLQSENSGPELREVTVLFSDLRDFTALSAQLEPAEVVRTLNAYHTEMVEAVFLYGGTLDKFIGDGLMAYFGGPLPDADHALHAIQCALSMKQALVRVNDTRAAVGAAPLRMGVGLHTGPVVLGDVGSPERRLEFTAIGDTVNVASRMEGLTKQVGEVILASEATWRAVGERTQWREGPVSHVKGKTEPLRVFVPLDQPAT